MIWIGPQPVIAQAAAACNAAADSQPQTDGSGSPLPEAQRVTMQWSTPRKCEHCSTWILLAPPSEYGVTRPDGVTETTQEAFDLLHNSESDVPKTTSIYTACAVVKLTTPRIATGDISLLIASATTGARVLSIEIASTVSAAWQLEKRTGPDTGGKPSTVTALAFDHASPAQETRCVAYGNALPTPADVLGLISLPPGATSSKTFVALDPSGFRLAPGEALACQCGPIAASEIRITWTWAEDR